MGHALGKEHGGDRGYISKVNSTIIKTDSSLAKAKNEEQQQKKLKCGSYVKQLRYVQFLQIQAKL